METYELREDEPMLPNDPWYDLEWEEDEDRKARIRSIVMKAFVMVLLFVFIDLSVLASKIAALVGTTIGIVTTLALLASFLLMKSSGDSVERGV